MIRWTSVLAGILTSGAAHAQALGLGGLASIPANTGGGYPGQGFSRLDNNWRGKCIAVDPASATPNPNAFNTVFDLKVVDTLQDYDSFMGMSVSASVSFGVYGGDMSSSYSKTIMDHQYSHFVAGKVLVYTPPIIARALGLTTLGKQALATRSIDKFHNTCGTDYVASTVYGGEFIFILEITSRDDAEYQSIGASLRAKIGTFGSGSATFSQAISDISKTYTLTASVVRNGLSENLPDTDPTTYVNYALAFPQKLSANSGAGLVPIKFSTLAYPTAAVNAPDFRSQEGIVDQLASKYLDASIALGVIDAWEQHPEQYDLTLDQPVIARNKQAAINALGRIDTAVSDCSISPSEKCVTVPIPVYSTSNVPSRLVWQVLPVLGPQHITLGVVPIGQHATVRLRGSWLPSCGNAAWIGSADGNWKVQVTDPQGQSQQFDTPIKQVFDGGSQIDVWLYDTYYPDNCTYDRDPASAALVNVTTRRSIISSSH